MCVEQVVINIGYARVDITEADGNRLQLSIT